MRQAGKTPGGHNFQDPKLDGQFLYERFGLVKEYKESLYGNFASNVVDIVPIKDVTQYHVPFEL